jgi:2-polyprenyl-6-methoxyphenol hydroxylase-like FAD-dependent oxidoreductase
MPNNITAIIIGGGIASPVMAITLQKIGISCAIYELRPRPATIGGAIGLSPNAVRVLDHLGLYEEISKIGLSYKKIEMFSLSLGSLLGHLPFRGKGRFGYNAIRVGRNDLQVLMLRAAVEAGVQVRYRKNFVGVERGKTQSSPVLKTVMKQLATCFWAVTGSTRLYARSM